MFLSSSVATFLLLTFTLSFSQSPPLQLPTFTGFEADSFYPFRSFVAGVRLPRDVAPVHYDLKIRPIINLPLNDPQQFTAPGEVTITLKCLSPTSSITLHSNDIDILHDAVSVKIVQTSISIRVLSHSNDSSLSTYTINLESELSPTFDYELFIPFTAKVGNRLSGLYRSSYVDSNGEQKWLATTQFQKTGARMAFPCFDEPGFRSTFDVSIGRAAGYNTLANSRLRETVPIPGMPEWFWDIHETTVRMPTYLIAIIASDFVSVDAPSGISPYDVKIWGPPTMTNNATAEFSSKSSAQILSFFENYLDSPFQFPKLASAAIPDFSAGAMENWALNTYRLIYLLYIDGESTQIEQWRQAAVLAHEISHHWFGDLVTCDWWNDIWLNEGFASYMEIIGANATGVSFGAMDRYPIDKIQLAMEFDAGATTEPVRSNVTDQITNQPSRIIYEKAASLIRMMQSFIGEKTFIGGIQNYLDKYAYQNTIQDQLFEELQAKVDQDGINLANNSVKAIMDSWTLQSGFPLVFVTHLEGELISLTQTKFHTNAVNSSDDLWRIPVTYATQNDPDFSETNWAPKLWLDTNEYTVNISGAENNWVIVNPDARSYYRVLYDEHFFTMITAQLSQDNNVISLASRSQMIDDYFKSAFAGYVPIEEALELSRYLANETENTVWTTVFNNLRQTNRYLVDAPYYSDFSDYLLGKITPALDRIGWEQVEDRGEAPVSVILRSQLLDWACSLGSPKCENVTRDSVSALARGTRVPADIQPVIFCKAVSIADSLEQFDIKSYLLEGYQNVTRAERFNVFINALACAHTSHVLSWLELVTSNNGSPFTSAHSIQLIQRLSENSGNRAIILNYFSSQLPQIITALGESSVSSMVSSMAAYTSDAPVVAQMKAFIDMAVEVIQSGSVRASLTASKSALDKNGDWMQVWGAKIGNWLNTPKFPHFKN